METFDYGTPVAQHGHAAIFKDMNMPPIQWMIDGLLKERGIGVLYGPSAVGKSFSVVDLASRVQSGMPFHGRTLKQGNVLYIAGEASDEVYERMVAWQRYHGTPDRPYIQPRATLINKEQQMKELAQAVVELDIKLVVFDTLSDCTAGVKLNDPDDVGESVKPNLIDFVRTTRASALLVHHTGHNESHERGAKVLRDMTDTTIKASKKGGRVNLTVEKLRRSKEGDKLFFRIEDVSDQVGIDMAAIVRFDGEERVVRVPSAPTVEQETPKKQTNADRLVAIVADHPEGIHWKDASIKGDWFDEESKKATSSFYHARDKALVAGRIKLKGDLLIAAA